jgi:hypothetical protein
MKTEYSADFFSFLATIIFILGFLGAIIVGNTNPILVNTGTTLSPIIEESFNWTLFFSSIIYVFLSGSVFLFFSTVVAHLESIHIELRKSNAELKKNNDKK